MKLKKIPATLCTMAICATMMAVPAFASTPGIVNAAATSQAAATAYPICPKKDCTLTDDHAHDGVMHSGHHDGDGQEYHIQEHANGTGHNGIKRNSGGHGGNHRR